MGNLPINLQVNGNPCRLEVRPNELLIEAIRGRLGLTGTKPSCGIGVCGACTVLLDGKAVKSCSMLALEAAGRDLLTIEGLGVNGTLHPLQESFIRRGGFQCGYCTPGMILTAKSLLDANPNPSATEIKRQMNGNLCRCTGYQMIVESILDAAARMRGEPAEVVPESVARVDGVAKVTGRAVYTMDLSLPGMLHARVLRSPFPHALIRRIDCRRAAARRGVAVVLTGETLKVASPNIGTQIKDQPILARGKVRYAGDIVAAVAAADEATAEEALQDIDVEYDELPFVLTLDEALESGAPRVHETPARTHEPAFGPGCSYFSHPDSNVCHHFRFERGDIQAGFAAAETVFEDSFLFPSAHHCALEPHVSTAWFQGDTLTVWSSTQSPFAVREEICRVLELPQGRVRVVVPYVGGGFGGQKSRTTAILASILSREAQRPVRLAFSSEEGFETICQPRMKVTLRTGLTRDGLFLARQCQVYLNSGAYASNSPSVATKAGYRAHGPYRIPNVLTDSIAVYTHTVPAGSFRGFGAPQVAFAYESHLDMIARRLGLDPVGLRMKNLLDRGEEYAPGDTPLDCDLKGSLAQLAESIQWNSGMPPLSTPGVRRGRGIACGMKDGGGTRKISHAAVRIRLDGAVRLFAGSVEMGQGVSTTLCQVVAGLLTVAPERVQWAGVDTGITPFDTGTHSSSATTIMGQAVAMAARDAAIQLLASADSMAGLQGKSQLDAGAVDCQGTRLAFQDIMRLRAANGAGEIVGVGTFSIPRTPTAPLGSPSPFWEIGLGAVEVEVDEKSGTVKLLRYISVSDAGTIIHPLQCRGQDEGSILFGMGQALSEELIYRDGRLVNGNLAAYRIPRFQDLPEVMISRVLEHHGGPGPGGAKGMGEAALLAVAPAICNAVHDATGVRLHEVPLTPERVWEAIGKRT